MEFFFVLLDIKLKRKLLAGAVLVTSLIHLTAKLFCLQLFLLILKYKRRQNNCLWLASNRLSLDKSWNLHVKLFVALLCHIFLSKMCSLVSSFRKKIRFESLDLLKHSWYLKDLSALSLQCQHWNWRRRKKSKSPIPPRKDIYKGRKEQQCPIHLTQTPIKS